MESEKGAALLGRLRRSLPQIEEVLRAIPPDAFAAPVRSGGPSIMEITSSVLALGIALKAVAHEPRINLGEIKPPSFVSGDEAASVFGSAAKDVLARMEVLPPGVWSERIGMVVPGDVRECSRMECAETILNELLSRARDIGKAGVFQ